MMNRDVFLSLLALDSYNRGYGQGLNGLSSSGSIGFANIDRDSAILGQNAGGRIDEQAGFYAIAYEWNGAKVISYRGTNFEFNSLPEFLASPAVKDALGGWTVGVGFAQASQAQLAIESYQNVTGITSIYDSNGGTNTLIGHSRQGAVAR